MPARAKILAIAGCALVAASLSAPVIHAAEYPEKPIRWVVPWPPGGGVDIATRALSPALAEVLGQSIIVENRPGASGMIGTSFAAKAAPDGYTILTAAAGPNAILPCTCPTREPRQPRLTCSAVRSS